MRKLRLVIPILILGLICSASLGLNHNNHRPTAKGSADAFASASAMSMKNYDPFSVAWTSTWTWEDAKIDPVSISASTGQSFALIDSFVLADAYSNAFAYAQGPNLAVTNTYTIDHAIVTDTSAYATAQSHAEGFAN
jgi:hypothetical protein